MDDSLLNLFKKARKDLFYPPIHRVEFADIELCDVDFSGRWKVLIGKKAVENLSANALIGILHHQLNHWAKHPYDAKTIILENYFLGDIPNKTEIRNLYDDIVVNLDLIINKELFQIAEAYKEITPTCKADIVLRSFFKEVTGLSFGDFFLEPELSSKVKALLEIDFLNTNRTFLKLNIRRFASIMEDLIEKGLTIPFGSFSLQELNPQDIRKSLRNLAKELSLDEYRRIIDDVSEEIASMISPGDETFVGEFKRADIKWYEIRTMDYMIYIESIYRDGSLYPNEIKDFDIEESIDFYSPVESYGMLIPGIAKKYTLEGFEGDGDAIPPDAVIIIDSSGSMTQPDLYLSHAVLSAFCLARNYLENGSKVGVVNFSDRNINLLPTYEKQKVYETLITYQGGGTTLHLEDFSKYLDRANLKGRRDIDYIIITDAGIHNLEALINYFKKIEGRVTLLWIKTGEFFRERFEVIKSSLPIKVTFVEIDNVRDMAKIAVGKAFKEYAEFNKDII
ncbi:MAG: VWA domain-containing protein [Thermodesulfovibrionales bacterium]|nr:VWA domain-containing protein [Thermodesulfovibrionales bacterium]